MSGPAHPNAPDAGRFDVFACPLAGIRLIEASAGTGKTWTLSALYLRLIIEQGIGVESLLVVTFTNAAIAELKSRIRHRLVALRRQLRASARQAPDPHDDTGGHLDPADPLVESVLQAARRAGIAAPLVAHRVERAMAEFDGAAIFTIHGFCQQALSLSPFAAGVPMHFDVETDDRAIVHGVVADFWRRRVAIEALPPALATRLRSAGDSPARWSGVLARQQARPLARLHWPESIDESPDLEALQQACAQAFDDAREAWRTHGDAADCLRSNLGALHGASYKPARIESAAQAWQALLALDACPDSLADADLLSLIASRQVRARTLKNAEPPSHPFFDHAQALLDAFERRDEATERMRLQLIRALLSEGGEALRRAKRKRRVLAFDDLLSSLHRALAGPMGPALAASLRERFPCALIDEFQDTDALQFEIFRRLFAQRGATPGASGTLILVGDPKQAIYGFRQADVHVYLGARELADDVHSLARNQRAVPSLIAAVNAVFSSNPAAFVLPALEFLPATPGTRERLGLLDASGGPREAMQILTLPRDESGRCIDRQSALSMAARATAAEVARLLDAGTRGEIRVGPAPLAAGHIAVLVRTRRQAATVREEMTRWGIDTIEVSQQSVFATDDARQLEAVLRAVAEPTRLAVVLSALASTLIGLDAIEIEALQRDELALGAHVEAFVAMREDWVERGIGAMLRGWITREKVALRLLEQPDGERRLTNLRHLCELLQAAPADRGSPHALLHWFSARATDAHPSEDGQLRLESDRDLVHIVTMHGSKGLEYDVVFCPFLFDAQRRRDERDIEIDYHDEHGHLHIDFRPDIDQHDPAIAAARRRDADAEEIRLTYVALTRAVHRCVLVAGCYSAGGPADEQPGARAPSTVSSQRSLLNWLVAGDAFEHAAWSKATSRQLPSVDAIDAAWQALASRAIASMGSGHDADLAGTPPIGLRTLADASPARRSRPHSQATELAARTPPAHIDPGWRLASFSSLMASAGSARIATVPGVSPPRAGPAVEPDIGGTADHDVHVASLGTESASTRGRADIAPEAVARPPDFLDFPRGPSAGNCVHHLLERAELADAATWAAAIDSALGAYPQRVHGLAPAQAAIHLQAMLHALLAELRKAVLPDGITLGHIPAADRLVELGFHLPAPRLDARSLNDWLQAHGHAVPTLDFDTMRGYLSGYIDLVFAHRERYYVLDWKTNHLGVTAADYAPDALARAMAAHGYDLQALLYALAVHRLLASRIAHYDYDTHFGGVVYAFVRGMRADWRADGKLPGVHMLRPSREAIESLDALIAATSAHR